MSISRAPVRRTRDTTQPGPYALQAAIAALHTESPPHWVRIAALYGHLALAGPGRPWSS